MAVLTHTAVSRKSIVESQTTGRPIVMIYKIGIIEDLAQDESVLLAQVPCSVYFQGAN